MCGRYAGTKSRDKLAKPIGFQSVAGMSDSADRPNFDVAPPRQVRPAIEWASA